MHRGRRRHHETHLRADVHLRAVLDEELVEDVVGFVEIEDDVELANRSEIFVQDLNVSVNDLQRSELVVCLVHGEAEEEAGVPLVHYAHIFVLNEVTHLLFPLEDHPRQLSDDFLLVFTVSGLIPLLKTQLSLSAEQKNEVNHSVCSVNKTASTYVGTTW